MVPTANIQIDDILDETNQSYKVHLPSGREVWISKRLILDAFPRHIVIPRWYWRQVVKHFHLCKDN